MYTKRNMKIPADFLRKLLVSQVDFTNPEAVVWYQGMLQTAVDLGFRDECMILGSILPQIRCHMMVLLVSRCITDTLLSTTKPALISLLPKRRIQSHRMLLIFYSMPGT